MVCTKFIIVARLNVLLESLIDLLTFLLPKCPHFIDFPCCDFSFNYRFVCFRFVFISFSFCVWSSSTCQQQLWRNGRWSTQPYGRHAASWWHWLQHWEPRHVYFVIQLEADRDVWARFVRKEQPKVDKFDNESENSLQSKVYFKFQHFIFFCLTNRLVFHASYLDWITSSSNILQYFPLPFCVEVL